MAWCRRQQAITWINVDLDLCRHMASLGHIELTCVTNYRLFGAKPLIELMVDFVVLGQYEQADVEFE